jgi:hypothetical protein
MQGKGVVVGTAWLSAPDYIQFLSPEHPTALFRRAGGFHTPRKWGF